MPWDNTRTVHPGWLAVEFGTCVGVWTVITFLIARTVSGPVTGGMNVPVAGSQQPKQAQLSESNTPFGVTEWKSTSNSSRLLPLPA